MAVATTAIFEITMNREQALSSVGPGWAGLITVLYNRLDCSVDWTKRNGPKLSDYLTVIQVKEKFGGLRIYTHGTEVPRSELANERVQEFYAQISFAESMSYRMCECCGAPGETKGWNGYWIRTLCPTHGAEQVVE